LLQASKRERLPKRQLICHQTIDLFSPIRTFTVGPGLSPDLLTLPVAGARGLFQSPENTAGGEFHPALRINGLFADKPRAHAK